MPRIRALLSQFKRRFVLDASLLLMSLFVFVYAYSQSECLPYGKLVVSVGPETKAASVIQQSDGSISAEVDTQKPRKPYTSHVFDPNDPEGMLKFDFMGGE